MWKLKFSKLSIKRIFLLGILIRLILMPFFAHDDLYSVHTRVWKIVCGPNTVFDHSDFGVHALESLFTKLTLPITPCSELAKLNINPLEMDHLNRAIFFFKLPYLLFEIGYWYLIWQLITQKDKGLKIKTAVFLALNPVMIYSVYIFGRFETYPVLFSTLILYLLSKYKNLSKFKLVALTSTVLAFTLTTRLSYALLIPALGISFGSLLWASISVSLTGGLFYLLKTIPVWTQETAQILTEEKWIRSGAHPNYLFEASIDTGRVEIYLFFLLMGIAFIWWLEKQNALNKIGKAQIFALFSALTLFAYYGTSVFHPQYLSWVMPFFLTVSINDNSDFLWKSFWLVMPFYFIYILTWGNAVSFGLMTPISIVFKHIDPKQFFPIIEFLKWVSIAKTIFSAFCFYWIFYLFKTYGKNN